tara:strand:- start:206 stop:952 length:747 start_codon:yes stop_codon:yes gene_type:complete
MNLDFQSFKNNGFIEIRNVIDDRLIKKVADRSKKVFSGKFSTKIKPDKIWWKKGDSKNIPRLISNAWRADDEIASLVLSKKISKIAALLMGWKSVKVNEDSLIWVPPKCLGLRFHKDNPYHRWHYPGKIITAWIPLSKIYSNASPLQYLIGSHKNKKIYEYKKALKKYKKFNSTPRKGSVVFHHGDLWHGTNFNKSNKQRLSLTVHFMDGKSKFHKSIKDPYFNRYKLKNSRIMLDDFFPKTWTSKEK